MVKMLAKVLFQTQIIGVENIPDRGRFILASNHVSHLDPAIIAVSINRKLYFLAKKELFENKTFGALLRMLNSIQLNREGIDKSALKESLRVLQRGGGLLVFPEGTRSRDRKLGEPKLGVALFAFGSSAQVIPVFVKGTEDVLPPGARFIKFAKVKVYVGKGIVPPAISDRFKKGLAYQEFANKVMEEIETLGKRSA